MKVSVFDGDFGYTVSLDGSRLKDCFAADDSSGEAWVYKRNKRGEIAIVEGETLRKKLTGTVVITDMKSDQ